MAVNHNTYYITLKAADWVDYRQTIEATMISKNSCILINLIPQDFNNYIEYGIVCDEIETHAITFRCTSVPAQDIIVNVTVLNNVKEK